MSWVGAGIIAAGIAYLVNHFSYKLWHKYVIVGAVPLVEEVAKTMSAYFFSADYLYTHFMFGVIEGLLDGFSANGDWLPAVSAVFAHSILGWITVNVIRETKMVGAGILAAIAVHIAWNTALLFRTIKR